MGGGEDCVEREKGRDSQFKSGRFDRKEEVAVTF